MKIIQFPQSLGKRKIKPLQIEHIYKIQTLAKELE